MRFVRLHRGNKNFAALIFANGSELTKIAKMNPLCKHAVSHTDIYLYLLCLRLYLFGCRCSLGVTWPPGHQHRGLGEGRAGSRYLQGHARGPWWME